MSMSMSMSAGRPSQRKAALAAALLPHQKKVFEHIQQDTTNTRLLVVHTPGSGKTYTALFTALANLIDKCVSHVHIVTPNQLLQTHFRQLLATQKLPELVPARATPNVTFGTYATLYRQMGALPHGTFLLLDEAHNLVTATETYDALWVALHTPTPRIKKCMLLTATPIVDTHTELHRLMDLLLPADQQGVGEQWKGYASVFDAPCSHVRVAYAHSATAGPRGWEYAYSAERYGYVDLPLHPSAYGKYAEQAAMATEIAFYTPLVHASVDRNKLDAVAQDVVAHAQCKFFVACGFIDRCYALAEQLVGLHTGVRVFVATSRNTTPENRDILADFNRREGAAVLIASRIMNEGITLKGVTRIHVLSPFWNHSRTEQTVSRAVRYDSHAPSVDQVFVHIYRAIPNPTPGAVHARLAATGGSIDAYMTAVADGKRTRNARELTLLARTALETCPPPAAAAAAVVRVTVPPIDTYGAHGLVPCVYDPQCQSHRLAPAPAPSSPDLAAKQAAAADVAAAWHADLFFGADRQVYIAHPQMAFERVHTSDGGEVWVRIVGQARFDATCRPLLEERFPAGCYMVNGQFYDLESPTLYRSAGRTLASMRVSHLRAICSRLGLDATGEGAAMARRIAAAVTRIVIKERE